MQKRGRVRHDAPMTDTVLVADAAVAPGDDPGYIMTKGGPGTSTRVLIQHIYETGFQDYQLGYAAAVSVFLFVVMALVSSVQFRALSGRAS